MLQAEETCEGPNQTAANRAGTERTNIWDKATTLWPKKPTQKRSGATEPTLIQAPAHVPIMPMSTAILNPCKCVIMYNNK